MSKSSSAWDNEHACVCVCMCVCVCVCVHVHLSAYEHVGRGDTFWPSHSQPRNAVIQVQYLEKASYMLWACCTWRDLSKAKTKINNA